MNQSSQTLSTVFAFSSTGHRWTVSCFNLEMLNFKLIVAALYVALSIVTQAYADTTEKPNFIIMLSDDQSWDGLSVQMDPRYKNSRSDYIQTPCLEKLAHQGMRFTQAYASAPVCSPTRIAIQTGKSPAQMHWTKAAPNVRPQDGYRLIPPQSSTDIPESEVTIAELLKTEGYMTAHFGKWHLGGGGPEHHGYDESDGNTSNREAASFLPPNPVDIFGMGGRATAFMQKALKEKKPFLIQMSYNALHCPENALPETIEKYKKILPGGRERRAFTAAISENLDTGVGKVLDEIDRMKLAGSTFVIYISDNGGGGGGPDRLLRGGKGNLHEGGIRIPCIIRGPGIKPDSFCSVPIVTHDLLPTLCKLAGVNRNLPDGVEGGDFSHLLTGSTGEVKRLFPGLAFHFPHYQGGPPHSTLRLDEYKIFKNYENGSITLYNVETDPGENSDITGEMPDKAQTLAEMLEKHLKSVNAMLPEKNPDYDPAKSLEDLLQKSRQGGGQIKHHR